MKHKRKYGLILLSSLIMSGIINTSAYCNTTFSTDVVKTSNIDMNSNQLFKQELTDAINKFENLNIKVSHQDFSRFIENSKDNDFLLVMLADKTAELGFFDLSNIASTKIKDVEISQLNIDNLRKFYFPKSTINTSDIIILAELYSNITFNDQAKESIDELMHMPRLLRDYDYANYLMALAYFNLKDITSAQQYIDIASREKPENINYQILRAKILAKNNNKKQALKVINKIDLANIKYQSMSNKIISAREYVNYLVATKEHNKNFYLGMYYFTEGDYLKASRVFQSGISKNKKNNAKFYSMLSRCYFNQGDSEKAKEYATKACKIVNKSSNALLTLGDIETKDGNFKLAIKYYKEASSEKNIKRECLEKMASSYIKLSNTKRGNEIYSDIIKEYPESYISYYKLANYNNDISTLKKSLSFNIYFNDAWIDLARIMIEQGNLELAKNYLSYANYIDDNNFRCYYYQSLLNKKETEIKLKNSNKLHNKLANMVKNEV